jgi:stage V sporulation protein R
MSLPLELAKLKKEIQEVAAGYGLDFFEVIFHVLDFDEISEVAAYGGFPTRYPHWRFGMEYDRLSKGYSYGLQKIYEMVINNDPCHAYLLSANNIVDQKTVMAHVYGHCDFFKNNIWFSKTNRKMLDEMANHGVRMRKFMEKYGLEKVESFVDACLSIENLIDYHAPFIQRTEKVSRKALNEEEALPAQVRKFKSKEYMNDFINPREYIDAQLAKVRESMEQKKQFPAAPQKDVLQFLIENAPLENWERDVLSVIREESYYFAPQGQTKIMNEGWATYWHSTIMTRNCLKDSEVIDYADHHSGTLGTRPGMINPYKIGVELFRDIEERWDKGRFGKEYEECENIAERKAWDKKVGLGREKIFEVRKIYNDVTFIDTFMTEEFCEKHKLFTYRFNPETGMYEIADRDYRKVKAKLLFSLTNFGQPLIHVVDANFRNRGELILKHRHDGFGLKQDYARDTLKNLQRVWRRPVHIETIMKDEPVRIGYDGHEVVEEKIGEPEGQEQEQVEAKT